MRLQSFYPIVVTEHLTACRDFYRRWFELQVVFEATWFVLLTAGESGPASLAFMHPGHLGALGTTGQRAWPGYEHVHLELQRGADPKDLHDPLSRMVGCFDASARYPADRLVLTYPVPC